MSSPDGENLKEARRSTSMTSARKQNFELWDIGLGSIYLLISSCENLNPLVQGVETVSNVALDLN